MRIMVFPFLHTPFNSMVHTFLSADNNGEIPVPSFYAFHNECEYTLPEITFSNFTHPRHTTKL